MADDRETQGWRWSSFVPLYLLGAFLSVPVIIIGSFWMTLALTSTPPRWTWCSGLIEDRIVYKQATDVSSAANGLWWAYFLAFWINFIVVGLDCIGCLEDVDHVKATTIVASWIRFVVAGFTTLAAVFYRQAVLNANCTDITSDPDIGLPLCRQSGKLLKVVWIVPGTLIVLCIIPCTVTLLMLLWKICVGIYNGVIYCCKGIQTKVQQLLSYRSEAKRAKDLEKGQYDAVGLSIEGQPLSSASSIADPEDTDDSKGKLDFE